MARFLVIFSFLLVLFSSCTTKEENKFNLNFERYDLAYQRPSAWVDYGEYDVLPDSVVKRSGKYALKIASNKKEDGFGYGMYTIPALYKGNQLKLEGYIKTEDLKGGKAGLFLRIDGDGKVLAFVEEEDQVVREDIAWTKFSVETAYLANAESIKVGGVLQGQGKAWFDDLKVTIDGKDIQTLEPIIKEKPSLKTDTAFDAESTIIFPEVTKDLTENLILLGRVWGFLKYHHPAVAEGVNNWDHELFRILPEYLEIYNKNDRDRFLINWIETLGTVKKCNSCNETDETAILIPNYSWLIDSSIDIVLKNKLNYIYENRFQGKGYYVDRGGAGQASFENEQVHADIGFPDQGYRLLALYRYWNAIQYFFPYRDITDTPWLDVLGKYIPLVIHCEDELEYEKVIAQLVGEINDTHGFITQGFNKLENEKGNNYPPFKVRFIEGKLVVVGYYEETLKEASKINIGDIITHIDHTPVEEVVARVQSLYAASNEAALLRNIADDILRNSKKTIPINYLSGKEEKQHDVLLYPKDDLNMKWYNYNGEKSYKVLEDNIGYITLRTISEIEIAPLKEALKNTQGIIIDIRNYPYTPIFRLLGPYFISKGTPYSKFSKPNFKNPGEFNVVKSQQIRTSEEVYEGKVIVLVNEETQSQGEHTAMLFQAGKNTTIVGSTTAGADGDIANIWLPGGLRTYFSGLGAYYPDNTPTQRVGIIPDVVVHPTINGIKNNKDELLEKAIELIIESSSN